MLLSFLFCFYGTISKLQHWDLIFFLLLFRIGLFVSIKYLTLALKLPLYFLFEYSWAINKKINFFKY